MTPITLYVARVWNGDRYVQEYTASLHTHKGVPIQHTADNPLSAYAGLDAALRRHFENSEYEEEPDDL